MATTVTAFVAGATGYVGRALVRELLKRGARTVAHVRPDSPRLAEWGERFLADGAEVCRAAWDSEAMAAALAACTPSHLFALVGTTRARSRADPTRNESYETVDYGLTRVLLEAATRLPDPPRFVYLSSAGTGPGARGAYTRARWKTEEAVRASGLPYTIARPSVITGEDRDERRPAERIGAALLRPGLALARPFLGAAFRERYRPTDAGELAFGLAHAALNYTTVNRVVEGLELRYRTANDEEYFFPRSRRDTDRH